METITQIAARLGISWTEAVSHYQQGSAPEIKPIRKRGYTKKAIEEVTENIGEQSLSVYAKTHGLKLDFFRQALEQHAPLWWANYTRQDKEATCPNCQRTFFAKPNQKYCSNKCGTQHRVNQDYFGGDRNNTIGLVEQTCQLCGRSQIQGLSSHHALGKENDPENAFLVALCFVA